VKDKLPYLTIGVLIGVVVMQWTMPSGQVSNAQVQSGAIALESGTVLDSNGDTWLIVYDHTATGWVPIVERIDFPAELPVPVEQVKLWSGGSLITQDNVAWHTSNTSPSYWINCGPWPGGAVQMKPDTWGGVKSKYEPKK